MSAVFLPLSILITAAITPGPNNVIVMRQAARRDHRRLFASILIISVSGTAMTMFAYAALGVGPPRWAIPIATAAGSLLLVWLAWRGWTTAGQDGPDQLGDRPSVVLAFQLLNPKGWLLAILVATSAAASGLRLWALGILVAVTLALCLSLWAAAGALMTKWLHEGQRRAVFDRVTAVMMAVFAALFATQLVTWG